MVLKDNVLSFNFGMDGIIHLNLQEFFPATQKDCKKLMAECVAYNYEERAQIASELLGYLQWVYDPEAYERDMKWYEDQVDLARAKAVNIQNEVRLEKDKDKRKLLKEMWKEYRKDAKEFGRQFVKLTKDKKKYESNIEVIKQMSESWY